MGLTINLEEVKDWKQFWPEGEDIDQLTMLISYELTFCGIHKLTEKNLDEVELRFEVRKLAGFMGSYVPTRADLEKRLGLKVNAIAETRQVFWTKVKKRLEREAMECILRRRSESERGESTKSGTEGSVGTLPETTS